MQLAMQHRQDGGDDVGTGFAVVGFVVVMFHDVGGIAEGGVRITIDEGEHMCHRKSATADYNR